MVNETIMINIARNSGVMFPLDHQMLNQQYKFKLTVIIACLTG